MTDTIPSLADAMAEIRRLRARVLELENAILDLVSRVTQPTNPENE